MSSCKITLDLFQREDSELKVSEKYKQLMQDSLSEDSLYIRAKDTFSVIFSDLQLTEKEKAQLVSEHVASMTTSLSGAAMQTALAWSKEERDGAYTLAKVKAETEVQLAQKELVAEQICKMQKDVDLVCANITATISNSYRENGMPTGYDADGCKPTGLDETGLKFHQTKQVEAATYQTFADAYRKSGIVQIGTDVQDNVVKGLSAPIDKITAGYTNQQTLNAERQRQAYEDSKINHMLNSLGVVTGQLMSAEIDVLQAPWLLDYMKCGMSSLLTPNSETPTPFDGAQTCSSN